MIVCHGVGGATGVPLSDCSSILRCAVLPLNEYTVSYIRETPRGQRNLIISRFYIIIGIIIIIIIETISAVSTALGIGHQANKPKVIVNCHVDGYKRDVGWADEDERRRCTDSDSISNYRKTLSSLRGRGDATGHAQVQRKYLPNRPPLTYKLPTKLTLPRVV